MSLLLCCCCCCSCEHTALDSKFFQNVIGTERREMVTPTQRNVIDSFICSYLSPEFQTQSNVVLLKFSNRSTYEATASCHRNVTEPSSGCPQLHQDTGLVVHTNISWTPHYCHLEETVLLCNHRVATVSVLGTGLGEPLVGHVSAVVAVVVGPAGRRGRIGLVVIFSECSGVVGGCVDVCLLELRLVDVGPFIW